MKRFLYILFGFVLVALFLSVLSKIPGSNSQAISGAAKPDPGFWLKNDDMLIYLEAITRIREHALYLDPPTERREIIEQTIKSYLRQQDAFSDYLTRQEYDDFKQIQSDEFVGIGLEIEKDLAGQIVCFPYPGSPAELAGIHTGDRLQSIDGLPVRGQSLITVAAMARGKKGSTVALTVSAQNGKEKRISVKRSAVTMDSVSLSWYSGLPVIKIVSFTRNSKLKFKYLLGGLDKTKPIILDLRDNAGGDFHVAIDSAMLLLEKHRTVVSIKSPKGVQKYESINDALNSTSPLFLWQNEGTASAAEVFIAALTQNNRAVSIGKKSFGKGTRQDVFELSDGSALVLTTAFLQTPDGTIYDGKGLAPSYPLSGNSLRSSAYLSTVKELLATDH